MLVEEHPLPRFCRSVQQGCRLIVLPLCLLAVLNDLHHHRALSSIPRESDLSINATVFFATKSRTSNKVDPQRQPTTDTILTQSRYRNYADTTEKAAYYHPVGGAGARRRGDGRVIYFLHIHKNGGSSMCRAAQLNLGVVRVNGSNNCNVQADARCCGGNDTLQAQQRYARTTRYAFVANEHEMYETMDPASYRYVVTLRNCQDRYMSHYRHVLRATKWRGSFEAWYDGQPDNYAVRMICGTRCSNVSKYQITPELFQYTLSRLDMFEDLLFVEDYTESYRRFAKRVQWNALAPVPMENMAKKVMTPDANATVLNKDFQRLMSPLDDALYQYARQKYDGVQHATISATNDVALKTYFQFGPTLSCASVCTCHGNCSKFR